MFSLEPGQVAVQIARGDGGTTVVLISLDKYGRNDGIS